MKLMHKKWILGFTIMELLVVFSVLGVVTSGGVFTAVTQVNKAQDARRKQDLSQLQKALENYYNDFGSYPASGAVSDCGGSSLSPYVAEIPCDPATKQAYGYVVDELRQNYELYAELKRSQDESISSVGCSSGCGPEGVYNYGVASAGIQLGTIPVTAATTSTSGTTGGSGSGTGSGGSGGSVTPECGTSGQWFCYPGVCGECCPGLEYRCDSSGDQCVPDSTCG